MGRFLTEFLLLLGCFSCALPDEMPEPGTPVTLSASVAGTVACCDPETSDPETSDPETSDPETEDFAADRSDPTANPANPATPAAPAAPDTRTSMTGSTAAFVSGDRIGVSETLTGRSNVLYTFNGTAWSTAATMYWRNGTSTHTFYAYYPYQATSTGTTAVLPLLNNQTVSTATQVPDATCDMLVAGPKTQVRTAGTSVALTFTHAFSLLQFNIKLGSLLNLYVLNNVTVQGGNLTDATNRYGLVNTTANPALINYNLATGAIQDYGNQSTVYATSISRNFSSFSLLTSTTPFYFLILPGTYNNPKASVRITVALAGLISTGQTAQLPQSTFAPGTKYTYSITVGGLLRAAPEIKVRLVCVEPIRPETLETPPL